MARNDASKIYSATYSNVPVYEFTVDSNHVMRRREDDWINATHILKVAGHDKPTRTRILEREVQKQHHEKVQGGYGKYQGTWIPLHDGKDLAIKNHVYEVLRPIFDFVPGDRSPPPAPKHATAASSRPRAPRAQAQPRRQPAQSAPDYAAMDTSMRGQETPDNATIVSESGYEYDDHYNTGGSRNKRRRVERETVSQEEAEFLLWAEDLFSYFVLRDDPEDAPLEGPPIPPLHVNLNRPIDDKGYTAMHWAVAMAETEMVKDLIRRGAAIDIPAKNGDTPLMRAVIFTNSFDRQNMEKLAGLLIRTVNMQEWSGSTVFHHVAAITERRSRYPCARYYMDALLNKMVEVLSPHEIEAILNVQDQNGDTAITIAARNGSRKCVRSLIGRNAAVDIPNNNGETADQLIVQLNNRRQERHMPNRQLSSSPFQADGHHGSTRGGAVQPHLSSNGIPFDPLVPHSSLDGHASHINGDGGIFTSEPALHLTASVAPALIQKMRDVAAGYDGQHREKDMEEEEAKRVVDLRHAELEATKKQRQELIAREAEQTRAGQGSDDQLATELANLEAEVRSLVEREEELTYAQHYATSRAQQDHSIPESPADTVEEDEVSERLGLVRRLITIQSQRRDITTQMTHYLSTLGQGDRQSMYRTLISGALGVSQSDVESLLPEILSELEEARGLEGVGA